MATPTPTPTPKTPTPTPTPSPTPDPELKRAIVASGQSLSEAIDCGTARLAALLSPAALTTNSARLIFHGSKDGVSYAPIYTDAGTNYIAAGLTTAEARWITIDRNEMFPYRWIKFQIVAAGSTAGVAQGANRIFSYLLDDLI